MLLIDSPLPLNLKAKVQRIHWRSLHVNWLALHCIAEPGGAASLGKGALMKLC